MKAPRRLPLSRRECVDGPRPCPHGSCRHHLGPELARQDAAPEFSSSCALDVADRGGASVEEVAAVLGVSPARVRAIEEVALRRLLPTLLSVTITEIDAALAPFGVRCDALALEARATEEIRYAE